MIRRFFLVLLMTKKNKQDQCPKFQRTQYMLYYVSCFFFIKPFFYSSFQPRGSRNCTENFWCLWFCRYVSSLVARVFVHFVGNLGLRVDFGLLSTQENCFRNFRRGPHPLLPVDQGQCILSVSFDRLLTKFSFIYVSLG